MAIQGPFYDILPAYRPVVFVASTTSLESVLPLENAVVSIYKNAVLLTVVRYKYSEKLLIAPDDYQYTFIIDIQKYCQDSLAPDTVPTMPLPFASEGDGLVVCIDMFAEYSVVVTYEGISPTTSLLTPKPATADTSSEYTVFSITTQHTEPIELSYYSGTALGGGHCLTKSSTELNVCSSDNTYLTFISPLNGVINRAMQVKLYDSAGILLSEGIQEIVTTNANNMFSANVGYNSLAAVVYTAGAPNFADPNLSYYTASFGWMVGIVYTIATNIFTYTIINCCQNRSLRLNWLNLLGGVDSYTFNSVKDYKIKTNSETGKKSLFWDAFEPIGHSVNDYGGFKYNSQASTSFSLQSKFLTNADATWLQDLLVSPKVYVEIDGDLVPVLIEDTEQSIDRHNGRIRYEITVKMANDLIIQRV